MGKIYSNIKWPDSVPSKKMIKNININYFLDLIIKKMVKDKEEQGIKQNMINIKISDIVIQSSHYLLYKHIIDGEAMHIFIESEELFNWLYNLEIKDDSLVLDFINNKKIISPLNDYIKHKNDVLYNLSIIIHHKNIEYESFKFFIVTKGNSKSYFILHEEDKLINKYYFYDSHEDNNNLILPKSLNLIFNLLFYISAFSDNLIDSPPSDIYISDHYKGNNKYLLKTHPTLLEHGYTSPHFRRGHFRYLQNERYKEKRFHTVFVKSSFIHGDAKTVIEDKILN
jgi:hypothetical protein